MAFQPLYAAPLAPGQVPSSDNVDLDQAFAQSMAASTGSTAAANDNEAFNQRLTQLEQLALQQSLQQASAPQTFVK
jgi:hypothetical protein